MLAITLLSMALLGAPDSSGASDSVVVVKHDRYYDYRDPRNWNRDIFDDEDRWGKKAWNREVVRRSVHSSCVPKQQTRQEGRFLYTASGVDKT